MKSPLMYNDREITSDYCDNDREITSDYCGNDHVGINAQRSVWDWMKKSCGAVFFRSRISCSAQGLAYNGKSKNIKNSFKMGDFAKCQSLDSCGNFAF